MPKQRAAGPSAFNITNQTTTVAKSSTNLHRVKGGSFVVTGEKKKKKSTDQQVKRARQMQPPAALVLPGFGPNRRSSNRNEVLF